MKLNNLKIFATSDTHGNQFTVPECDIFCHCGDWSPLTIQNDFIAMQHWLEEFITYLCSLPCKYVIIIAGNHDLCMESITFKDAFENIQYRLGLHQTVIENGVQKSYLKVHYLNRTSVVLDGIKFWGSPVTKQINRYVKYWAFETNTPKYEIPNDANILLTHQPPNCNGLGNTYWRQNTPSKRFGSDILYNALQTSNARLLLCGHVHTGNHKLCTINNQAKTLACNVSFLDEQYQWAYAVTELNLDLTTNQK